MDVIRRCAPTDEGLRVLSRDLRLGDGARDARAQRPEVARRLVAAGLPPHLLDRMLPGWGCHLVGPESPIGAGAHRAASEGVHGA